MTAVAQLGVQPLGATDSLVTSLPQPILGRAGQAKPGQAGQAGAGDQLVRGRDGGIAADRLAWIPRNSPRLELGLQVWPAGMAG